MVETLQEQVAYLKGVVATRDEELRRVHILLSQMAEHVPALEPARGTQNGPETSPGYADVPEGAEPRPAPVGAQEGAERRSWWRRWFGFE